MKIGSKVRKNEGAYQERVFSDKLEYQLHSNNHAEPIVFFFA